MTNVIGKRQSAKMALVFLACGLAGCAGMTAPYSSAYVDRENYIPVTPITPELLAGPLKLEPAAAEQLPAQEENQYRYTIKPGDVLMISVPSIVTYNTPGATVYGGESGQGYTVYDDGTIYLPFGGSVEVGGLSPREAQDRVVEVLGKYLKTPQVVVSIQQFRSQRVMVTGQVAKPGYQPLTDVPLTLLAAISNAGGTAELRGHNDTRALGANNSGQANDAMEFPDLSHVILRRNDREYVIDVQKILRAGEVSRDVTLQDGDVVVVPPTRRGNVYVLGEVMRPALVEIRPEATDLAEVLLAAGGVNQLSANPRRIYVIRGDFAGPEIYQLNSKAPDALLLAQQFPMKSQDVVYVAEAPVGYWNRTLSQILPTLQGLLSTAVIANTVDTLNRNN